MSLDDLRQLLRRWPDLLVVALVISPIIWAILNTTYRNRLEAMREDIDRLRARLGDEPTSRRSGPAEPLVAPVVAPASAQLEDVEDRPVPEMRPHQQLPTVSSLTDFVAEDPQGYPAWYKALPPLPPEERAYLPLRAAKEIREAMRALPPLSRDSAAKIAYVGKWIRSNGIVRTITERQQTLSVFVVAGDGDYFLDFPLRKRPQIEALREGQEIRFEGQIHFVGDGHVSLIHVLISAAEDGEVQQLAT